MDNILTCYNEIIKYFNYKYCAIMFVYNFLQYNLSILCNILNTVQDNAI